MNGQYLTGILPAKSHRDFLQLLSLLLLLVLLVAMPEIRAFSHKGALVDRWEIVFYELLFITSVLANRKIPLPGWGDFPGAIRLLCVVWLAWGLTASLLAEPRLFNTFISYSGWYVQGLFGLTLWAYLQQYRAARDWLPGIIVSGFLVYAVFLSYSYIFAEDVVEKYWKLTEYGFNHIRHFGYYMILVLPFAAGLMVMGKYSLRSPLVWFGFASTSIVWAFVFWAGGRGPVMAFAVSSLLMYPLLRRITSLKYFVVAMLLSVSLGAALSFTMPKGFGLTRLFATVENSSTINQFSSGRLEIWKQCIGDISENPWFGVGPDNYKYNCGLKSPFTGQPHGFHVQSSLDWGLPGAALFFVFMGLILKKAFFRLKYASDLQTTHLLGLWGAVTLLVLSFVDGTLYYAYPMMFIAAGLALAFQTEPATDSAIHTRPHVSDVYLIVTVITVMVFYVL